MPSITHNVAISPSVWRAAQATARFMPAAVVGNSSVATGSPVAATKTARV
ncbi:hypothetical protein DSM43518_03214 [Mycobacterium marinum]|nr:hypothetical protein DSM43518_03214 [Mycobacterium marinum]